jgi:hypothetical protein
MLDQAHDAVPIAPDRKERRQFPVFIAEQKTVSGKIGFEKPRLKGFRF